MSEMTIFGLLMIWTAIVAAMGSYFGRYSMLLDLGMTWSDYRSRLNGRRPA